MPMKNKSWIEAVAEHERTATPYAIVTVLATAGSTPRSAGSKMVVTAEDTYASIGGGQLEFLAVQRAREALLSGANIQQIKQFSLGAEAKQCCGGAVTLFLEVFAQTRREIVIFGAGHVSKALLKLISELPYSVRVIDSRRDFIEQINQTERIAALHDESPWQKIPELHADASILVLTHDHTEDYEIIKSLLDDWRWSFVGLIGSKNKARRFSARLKREGYSEDLIRRIQCPMGMPEVKGKLPMEVAISIVAHLLTMDAETDSRDPMSWKQMKHALKATQATADSEDHFTSADLLGHSDSDE